MRKIFLTAIASMAIATTFALADADVMASRYGNTTISTDAKGAQTKVYYKADHTFTFKSGDQQGKGTWKVESGKVCLTYTGAPPPGMTNPFCAPVTEHKVGDKWTVGEGDNKRSVSLEKGMQ
jgi:hypothetical protein